MGSGQREHKQHLIGLARHRAFETYLRFGRMPERDVAPAEGKAIDPSAALPAPARPTSFYVWRSTGDDRVRHSHAARHGQVFSWLEPPAGGHPGTEPNCRCWAAPYYGDPSIPDALQSLQHAHQVDSTGSAGWTSIDTLTRPDGSLAQSVVVLPDGTQIDARFTGTLIQRVVSLGARGQVRVDTASGVQSVYLGRDARPLFQSAWTSAGPRVIRARQHVAFMGNLDTLIEPDVRRDPLDPFANPSLPILDPNPLGSMMGPDAGGGLALVGLAMLAIYATQQAAPASQGLGESDKPVIVLKTWSLEVPSSLPVRVDAQTEEQIRQSCKNGDAIEAWAAEAMLTALTHGDIRSPQTIGTRAHKLLKDKVDEMRQQFPMLYGNLRAEISFVNGEEQEVRYGTKGSSRLDILEDRRADMNAICVYDLKTGSQGLTQRRVERIGKLTARVHPGASIVYITQVGPTIGGNPSR